MIAESACWMVHYQIGNEQQKVETEFALCACTLADERFGLFDGLDCEGKKKMGETTG